MKRCYLCHETEDVSEWEHPENGTRYLFCGYCRQSIIGVCGECSSILSKFDPIGVNAEGKRICYKCSALHDMAEDER